MPCCRWVGSWGSVWEAGGGYEMSELRDGGVWKVERVGGWRGTRRWTGLGGQRTRR